MSNQELPLMRKATAVWLVDNTCLTFKQIADFCGLHILEVQGIADGDVASGIVGQSPISSGQLTKAEIEICEKDETKSLALNQSVSSTFKSKTKKKVSKYTPIARRGDKPDGIAYLLKYYPNISNAQIKKLVGTTDKMIDSIRNKTHWNMKEIKPRDVVLLGLCSQSQFNDVIAAIEEAVDKIDSKEVSKKTKKKSKK